MKPSRCRLLLAATLFPFFTLQAETSDWPRYRGPNGSGMNPDGGMVPTEWNATTNLKWKIELPGPGHSSPVVVGDRVFLTCWTGYGISQDDPGDQKDLRLHLLCIDRKNGKTLWSKAVEPALPEQEYRGNFTQHGYASHTPVSDGQKVFAYFGKTGVVAFDLEGNQLWQAKVGNDLDRRGWGSASSPIVHQNLLIVTASIEDQAIVALDKETGKEVWREKADGFAGTWSTPAVVTSGERTDLVLSVPYEIWGLNPETGRLRWYCEGSQDNTACSSIIVHDDIVYVIGGRQGGTVAVRAGGKGDVTQTHRLWESSRSGRTASPIYHDGRIYWINSGFAYCLDAKSGREIYRERLTRGDGNGEDEDEGDRGRGGFGGGRGGYGGGADYASPVASGDKLYQLKRNGEMVVIQLGPKFVEIAKNHFDGGGEFSATPAISQGDLFVRSTKHLYCVGKTE